MSNMWLLLRIGLHTFPRRSTANFSKKKKKSTLTQQAKSQFQMAFFYQFFKPYSSSPTAVVSTVVNSITVRRRRNAFPKRLICSVHEIGGPWGTRVMDVRSGGNVWHFNSKDGGRVGANVNAAFASTLSSAIIKPSTIHHIPTRPAHISCQRRVAPLYDAGEENRPKRMLSTEVSYYGRCATTQSFKTERYHPIRACHR